MQPSGTFERLAHLYNSRYLSLEVNICNCSNSSASFPIFSRREELPSITKRSREIKCCNSLSSFFSENVNSSHPPIVKFATFLNPLVNSPVWSFTSEIFERLLADDLFLTKIAIEYGVGIFTKTAAELERRRENFTKELDFVFADVVMAIIADFMLVWLPAPTVSLRPPLTVSAGRLAKFFYGCPDNAFQVALAGTSYSLLQRIGAIVRNGAKLFAVGTGASLVSEIFQQ
ncbi:hypothetical protein L3X38_009845 [Prunus dulcis]|uniref:Protein RETICULATA-RELATED 4, chloroplastic-like n=1 Tax=Prunus dulcis TaxID=3755 RepID=A0AAD4WEE8_PRUDU|nr:hypothetical protein L3X38_009845 [Prunus dulcis]